MMAASGGDSTRAGGLSSSGSGGAFSPPSSTLATGAALTSAGDDDMEFGAFSMAERTSDPYADVYGAEPDFAAPSTANHSTQFSGNTSGVDMGPSLLPFSPLGSDADPFADITGGVGAVSGAGTASGADGSLETATTTATMGAPASAPSSRSASADILDLVWGTSSSHEDPSATTATQSSLPAPTSASTADTSGSGTSSGFFPSPLPPPPSSASASFSTSNGAVSTGELLSFSPLKPAAEALSNDPFFGLSGSSSAVSTSAFDNDDLFSLSATTPHSASSSSAPASLHGSFASLHEAVAPPSASPEAAASKSSSEQTSSHFDPFAERATQSFGSLSSSFAAVGSLGGTAEQGTEATNPLATISSAGVATATALSSPSAPASLHGSFEQGAGMMSFATPQADDSDVVDPFEEAGLSFEQVPLDQALAAWDSGAGPAAGTEQEAANVDTQTDADEEGEGGEQMAQAQNAEAKASGDHEAFATVKNEKDDLQSAEETGSAQNVTTEIEEAAAGTDDYEVAPVQDASGSFGPLLVAETTALGLSSPTSSAVGLPIGAPISDESSTVEYAPFGFAAQEGDGELEDEAASSKAEGEQANGTMHSTSGENGAAWPQEQAAVGGFDDAFEDNDDGFVTVTSLATADENGTNAEPAQARALDNHKQVSNEESSVNDDAQPGPMLAAAETVSAVSSEGESDEAVEGHNEKEDREDTDLGGDADFGEEDGDADGFGEFGGFAAAPVVATDVDQVSPASDGFGSFSSPPAPQQASTFGGDAGAFGDFGDFAGASAAAKATSSVAAAFEDDGFGDFSGVHDSGANNKDGDDGFGGFAQSTDAGGDDDDFGDFGDFEQSSEQGGAANAAFNDDGFGDFTPAAVVVPIVPTVSSAADKEELSAFFQQAFPSTPLSSHTAVSSPVSPPSDNAKATDTTTSTPSAEFMQKVFCTTLDEYIALVTTTGRGSSSSSASLSSSPAARESSVSNGPGRVLQNKKAVRASKYLKYVLSEKIQEASRQNGIFPHGSDRHQTYVQLAASGDPVRMRAGLKELQDALFLNSVNDAMMRIAKQAALSAKAKIAEQAAQQQAGSRGGSLFATTRHLLSRSGASATGGSHSSGHVGNDGKGDHTGADTPTGASVQKLSRFSFASAQDDSTSATSGEGNRSEDSSRSAHSSGSESDVAVGVATGDSRTRTTSQATSTASSSSSGGLMKTFQARFSPFSSSRHRPRFVSLRRKGQSDEDVRQMELNLDAISGGLDEAKWKCAVFLYDVEEVAHVAPSQIRILAYPSKQPLTGKTDRSALVKLLKPGTIWTVDIGANNSDVLNEW